MVVLGECGLTASQGTKRGPWDGFWYACEAIRSSQRRGGHLGLAIWAARHFDAKHSLAREAIFPHHGTSGIIGPRLNQALRRRWRPPKKSERCSRLAFSTALALLAPLSTVVG